MSGRGSRYTVKRDANHAPIEAVFRKLLADHVTDSSRWADGAGDLFVSFGMYQVFIEIKFDEKKKYTAMQIRFQNSHPHAVLRCTSETQAVELCLLIRKRAELLSRT